jgi:hypothetical protein
MPLHSANDATTGAIVHQFGRQGQRLKGNIVPPPPRDGQGRDFHATGKVATQNAKVE